MLAASRYRITRLIRESRAAEILEAYVVGQGGFERRVAIKRLRMDPDAPDILVNGFIDEARIVSRLHHANIVSVFDFGVMDGVPFQVLELVDGLDAESLKTRAQETGAGFPLEIALHVSVEIAHALAYAHSAQGSAGESLGIVHRDVSPENILVSWAGDVKLADFGIALAADRSERTRVGIAKGKLSFMAPEQFMSSDVDARADIFSLGCVLHHLLTGRSPIDRQDARDRALAGGGCEIDRRLPEDVRSVLLRATRSSKADRYPTADGLARDLGVALAKRIDRDGRTLLREWLAGIKKTSGEPRAQPKNRLDELMNVELVLDMTSSSVRRFGSQVADPIADPTKTAPAVMRDGSDPLVGSVLHGYRIHELLGRGSMARVYRASHLVLDREYAVKVLHSSASDRNAKRLMREAQALGKLNHPNLVSVFDCGTTPTGLPFLTMELVRGRTLKDALRADGAFAIARAFDIVRQIALGLGEAHRHGLVHRDLKPGNIMLVGPPGEEHVKVLDFGIARAMNPSLLGTRLTASDMLLGTPRYMAPEQIRGASDVGPPADLYALGVVLYAMLAGQPPFRGPMAEVVHQHLTLPPPRLPASSGLENIAYSLLEKDPSDRLPSAEAVLSELELLPLAQDRTTSFSAAPMTRATEIGGGHPPSPPADAGASFPPPPAEPAPITHLVPSSDTTTWDQSFRSRGRSTSNWMLALLLTVLGFAVAILALLYTNQSPARLVLTRPTATQTTGTEAPVAVARATPSREPESAAAASVEPPKEPQRAGANESQRSAPRNPKRTKAEERDALAELGRTLARQMEARGLSMGEIDSTPRGHDALSRWRQALREEDAASADRALQDLLRLFEQLPIDAALLRQRIERVSEKLAQASGSIPPEVYEPLENRYLDARSAIKASIDASQSQELSAKITALERDIATAMKNR